MLSGYTEAVKANGGNLLLLQKAALKILRLADRHTSENNVEYNLHFMYSKSAKQKQEKKKSNKR